MLWSERGSDVENQIGKKGLLKRMNIFWSRKLLDVFLEKSNNFRSILFIEKNTCVIHECMHV